MSSIFEQYKFKKNNSNSESKLSATASTSKTSNCVKVQLTDVQEVNGKNEMIPNDLGDLNTGPVRPVLQVYPKTKFGTQNRSFSCKLYSDYDWLEYSVKENLVFCFCCRIFGLGNNNEDTFSSKGFQNWRKIKEKLKFHSSSKQHLINKSKYVAHELSKKKGTVVCQLSENYKKEIQENREYFSKIIDILLFMCRQGIPFRGHFEDKDSLNQGNFKEACQLISKFDEHFCKKYNYTTNYSSWSIQNQLLNICAQMVRDKIIEDIQVNGFFALMCDEARSFKGEQMSICVRYTKDLEIHERFLGFVEVSKGHDADFLSTIILNFLQKSNIGDSSVIAQSHDGASVMSGRLGGVQAKIKEKYPLAIYTHCMAHRLNLVIVDMCKIIKGARNLFNGLEAIYIHFSFPSKNLKLQEVQKELGMKNKTMLHMSDTRWVCRYKNCDVVIEHYAAILQILQEEIEENSDRNVSQAIGIYTTITTGSFIVHLFIFHEVLCIINILSNKLQQKTATLGKAVGIIKSVIDTFESKRSDDAFSVLFTNLKEFAKKYNISLEAPLNNSKRSRKEPSYFRDFSLTTITAAENDNIDNSVENFWKTNVYFVILDTIIMNLKKRFSEESLLMASAVDNFLTMNFEDSQVFINHYKDLLKIDIGSLKAEMIVAKNLLMTVNTNFGIEDIKKSVEISVYPNLYKLLQIAFTLPISSATCERSFSALKKIKTLLRVSMGQERLTDLSILYIEKDLTNQIDKNKVISIFATQCDRRMLLI